MATPAEQIATALTDPQSISADGVTVGARPISDLIAGLNYAAAIAALNKRRRGIRYSQLMPQGPINLPGDQVTGFNQGIY